jgi:NAD(P)H-flavin reductase
MEITSSLHVQPRQWVTRVAAMDQLSSTGYALQLERGGLVFRPGQLVNLHGRDHLEDRSYTICSGDRDEFLTVLFRLIPSGILTPQLVALRVGDALTISGPYGEFMLRDAARPIFFFATGTGVAPCRAYLRSFAGLDLTLVHGVRREEDLFYREEFSAITYQPCLTAEPGVSGVFHGRVTDYAREHSFPPDSHFYLCGANEMIYEMQEILSARGVAKEQVFTEAYYYRSDDA